MHEINLKLLDERLVFLQLGVCLVQLLLQVLYVTLLLCCGVLQLCQLCIELPVTILQSKCYTVC